MICHGMKKVRDGQSLFATYFWQKGWQMMAEERWEMERGGQLREWEEHKYEVEVDGREENNCLIA